ncbi:hypothetical protein [Phreatobacter oligotrophus]|jgi:hypothetical protein|uniref:Uncharacterized protein n=1 Tax=Phreatobacter oligotrophus TaxID=1122261 RepID=A0A2T4ZEU1_9HYPH|nr:hypothetical protein [Phreatobacter oligotrophus]PTM60390.1 hypothetical protein C8P69_103320 [Phreatobacter oligotrophus]
MGLLDAILGRQKKIASWSGLEDFIDARAAFLVNRSMYEYSRARAGILAEKLFREQSFKDAIEEGRWRAFPLSVSNVLELVDGHLRSAAAGREPALLDALIAAGRNVLGRYPCPAGVDPEWWGQRADGVETSLRRAALAEPKAPQDICKATFDEIFALVPIHPDLMKLDREVVLNHMRGMMVNMAGEAEALLDRRALAGALATGPAPH